jgi:hypothetical protein
MARKAVSLRRPFGEAYDATGPLSAGKTLACRITDALLAAQR